MFLDFNSMIEYFAAFIISVVEGLTEFLPVSSTGHMIIVEDFLKKALTFEFHNSESFSIFIQLGAILAVVIVYFDRFLALVKPILANGISDLENIKGQKFAGFKGCILLGLSCLPVFVLGFLFHSKIKELLFNPITVSISLIIGGIIMIIIDKPRESKVESIDEISFFQAFIVGASQCLALIPGMSRSASTIIGGMLVGLKRGVAAEFSFLVAVPVMCAAVGYDMLKSYSELSTSDIPIFAFGFVVSFIVAIIAIRWFVGLLSKITFAPFGWYRIALGGIVLLLNFAGVFSEV